MRIARRAILIGGVGALGLGGIGALAWGRRGAPVGPDATRDATAPAGDLDALVDALLASDAAGCVGVAARAMHEGMTADDVLTAALLLPILSGGDAGDVHAMAAVPAARRLAHELDDREDASVVVLWAVANAHAWSRTERLDGRGARAGAGDSIDRARRLAVDASQPRNDPHVAIWAAQATRELAASGPYGDAVLGSVTRYANARPPTRPQPTAIRTDDDDATPGADVARALRASAATPLDGVGASAIWEALAMLCVEARLGDPSASGPGVHATTALDALFTLDALATPAERGMVLARAVAWITRLTAEARYAGPPVVDLDGSHGDFRATGPDDVARAYAAALGALARGGERFAEELLAELRARVAAHGSDAHDFKHWGAVIEIGNRLDGAMRDRWLASLAASRVVWTRDRWDRWDEARRML